MNCDAVSNVFVAVSIVCCAIIILTSARMIGNYRNQLRRYKALTESQLETISAIPTLSAKLALSTLWATYYPSVSFELFDARLLLDQIAKERKDRTRI